MNRRLPRIGQAGWTILTVLVCMGISHVVTRGVRGVGLPALNTVIRLTSVGLHDATRTTRVMIYGEGRVLVGTGAETPRLLTDTLTLDHLPAITADLSNGSVHIRIKGRGTLKVAGDISGGWAGHVGASGRHIVLLKDGKGISSR